MDKIFDEFRNGKTVRMGVPSYKPFMEEMNRTGTIVNEINKNWLSMMNDGTLYEKEAEMLDKPLGKNASFLPPFQIDLGCQITIGDNAFVNHSFTASAAGGIDIEEGVMIAPEVKILSINHDMKDKWLITAAPVRIKKNAWIGANVTICPGVTIGENSVIGAGSVVSKSIPDNCIAVGNPARVIKSIDMETGETTPVPGTDKISLLMRRVQELEDREAIRNVLDTFSNTADIRDMEAQGQLFTEDAKVIQHMGNQENVLDGRKGIMDAFSAYLPTTDFTYHFNGQQNITFEDETHATVLSYCMVAQKLPRDGKSYLITGGAHYKDQFVKEEGVWKIKVRDQYPDYMDNKEISTEN